jgi:cytochrome c
MDQLVPIPRDIPLPMPAPTGLLQAAIVVFFLLHIIFVNFTLGGALATLFFEWLGFRRGERKYDRLAREIAATITVNKSLAVVLGVGPLLAMNVLYSTYFYTANALTGTAWIGIIPAAITAFLLLYWHKYSWDAYETHKKRHLAIVAAAVLLLLAIPLIFLTNINLMLFPEKWPQVHGYFSALFLPNVLPRYLHFLLATLAATGLLLAWRFGRRPIAELEDLTPARLRRGFYKLTLAASAAQFIAGPLVYFTLPSRGITPLMIGLILAGATLALGAIAFLFSEIYESDERIGRGYWVIVGMLCGTVALMGTGRHLYREASIQEHRTAMLEKTAEFERLSNVAYLEYQAELAKFPPEQRLFTARCGACHAVDTVRVGPPLREIATIYLDRPEGIVAWALAPGKKRTGFPQMPSMKHVGEKDLQTIAEYMLATGASVPLPVPSATVPK